MGFEYINGLPPIHYNPFKPKVYDLLIYPFSFKKLTHTWRDPRSYQKRVHPLYLLFIQPYILCSPNSTGQIKDVKFEMMTQSYGTP